MYFKSNHITCIFTTQYNVLFWLYFQIPLLKSAGTCVLFVIGIRYKNVCQLFLLLLYPVKGK